VTLLLDTKGEKMKQCNSLEEVRKEIDILDTLIVDLISQRSHYVKQAANFKNSIEEVKAQERIEHIMQKVRQRAIKLNINPNMISELFEIMINEMVETEISEFRDKKSL
jgi:isochorismate pyruvate lyase